MIKNHYYNLFKKILKPKYQLKIKNILYIQDKLLIKNQLNHLFKKILLIKKIQKIKLNYKINYLIKFTYLFFNIF